MTEPNDKELQVRLKQLQELLDDGTLTQKQYQAQLKKLGVTPPKKPRAARTQVERQVIAQQYVEQHVTTPEPDTTPAALRHNYLERVVKQAARLPLVGIDLKAASDVAYSDLPLSAVYTALLTKQHNLELMKETPAGGLLYKREEQALSALEMLNKEQYLVLLGDPGSGKSTFVNFVALCLAGEALKLSDANLAVLTAPLPTSEEDDKKKKSKPQPWRHKALLPVRIVLRELAARLPAPDQPVNAETLWASSPTNWAP